MVPQSQETLSSMRELFKPRAEKGAKFLTTIPKINKNCLHSKNFGLAICDLVSTDEL